jgi:hypothetical protein
LNYQPSIQKQNYHGLPLAEAFMSALLVLGVDVYRAQSVPPISSLGAGEAILLWLLALAFLRWLLVSLNERLLWPLLDRLLPAEEPHVLVLEMAPPWPASPPFPPTPAMPGSEPADTSAFWDNGDDNFFTAFDPDPDQHLASEFDGDDSAANNGGTAWIF